MRSVDEIARELACCRKEECRQRIAAALRETRAEVLAEAIMAGHGRESALVDQRRFAAAEAVAQYRRAVEKLAEEARRG